MNKNELLKVLDDVIINITNEMETTESAFNYVKLDVRKKTFMELKDYIKENLEEPIVKKENK